MHLQVVSSLLMASGHACPSSVLELKASDNCDHLSCSGQGLPLPYPFLQDEAQG